MTASRMRILAHWAVLVSLLTAGLSIHGGKAEALSPSVRVSVSSSGAEANDGSLRASISADGRYVAFESGADNLVSGDTNGAPDIFVHDRLTGETTRASLGAGGAQANGGSYRAAISGDGRYVGFLSGADNLVSGDTNNMDDAFVHDRQTGNTVRVSVSSAGEQGNDQTDHYLALSANGRFAVFCSDATNLVDGDNNARVDVFVHDLLTGQTERVNVSSDEAEANASGWDPSISADGNLVVFSSGATNLVAEDANSASDVFVRDRQAGATFLATLNSNGEQADHGGGEGFLSAGGRYVIFSSSANNLMSDDNYGYPQAFRRDLLTGETILVSSYDDYGPMVGWSEEPVLSSDGRYAAFEFDDKGDGLPGRVIQLHDCVTGETTIVAPGYDENDSSHGPALSADGRFLAFHSEANYIVPNDTNGASDVFEREVFTPVVKTYVSVGTYDGWVIESGEESEVGGHVDSQSTLLYVGDAANDQQYRAILHFDTSSLPNNAVITQAALKVKKQGLTGGNPFNALGPLLVDLRKPAFGAAALEASDFEAAAALDGGGTVGSGLSAGWYTALLDPSVYPFIHTYGATQMRLRFTLGDNDNQSADFLKLFSGDAAVGDQPYLYLEYYVPLEKYPTVLAILRASPNPTDANLVTYTVVFSESVTGVDAGDFVLTTSGVVHASVTSVSGSGDTWSVTVHTGAATGSLRLDLVDDDSIRDSMYNRLGGYDPGNGDFTGGEVYTILAHPSFADVPLDYWAWRYIESIYLAGITGGCGNGHFCPETAVSRAQMAVFLERGVRGAAYLPPDPTGAVFDDIPVTYWAARWVEQLAADGITSGCGFRLFCPEDSVTRAQMAVFLLRAEHGAAYAPPDVGADTGFADVPIGHWAAAWVKQLAAEGITGGCGAGLFCPEASVTRAQMAVFLQRTFHLALP